MGHRSAQTRGKPKVFQYFWISEPPKPQESLSFFNTLGQVIPGSDKSVTGHLVFKSPWNPCATPCATCGLGGRRIRRSEFARTGTWTVQPWSRRQVLHTCLTALALGLQYFRICRPPKLQEHLLVMFFNTFGLPGIRIRKTT